MEIFLNEIETDYVTVNSEIITLDFTVSKIGFLRKHLVLILLDRMTKPYTALHKIHVWTSLGH